MESDIKPPAPVAKSMEDDFKSPRSLIKKNTIIDTDSIYVLTTSLDTVYPMDSGLKK